tara:strand:- start:127415 stop:127960 length:546 start_codon:yes stop_codon:yes gene_type:complete
MELLEAQRIGLIRQLERLNKQALYSSLNDSNWSVTQILEHIILVEEQTVLMTAKRLNTHTEFKPISLYSWIKVWLMPIVLRLNFKFKAPSVVKPVGNKSLPELMEKWSGVRFQLLQLGESNPAYLKKGIFKHPFLGVLNFEQVLQFLKIHYSHHLVQMNKLVNQLNRSKKFVPKGVVSKTI